MATIVLGVTGSIAAYKAAEVASSLTQAGHEVRVIMTEAATHLVSPNTFLNLTGHPVHTNLWSETAQTEHIALTDRADLVAVAPATADSLAKLVHGLADDMLSTTLLAWSGPLLLCPAMNTRMWNHPAVRRNLELARTLGFHILPPDEGHLACGHTGAGRFPQPAQVVETITSLLQDAPTPPASHLFLEVVTYTSEPSPDALDEEQTYRQTARDQGTLVASGRLGSPSSLRYGHLHRLATLDEAMAAAQLSPLAQHNCEIEVFPWRLDGPPPLGWQ